MVGKGLAVATVVYRFRAARFMLRQGFQWDRYARRPGKAQGLGEAFLAAQIERGGRNSLPRYVDALNDVARFLERTDKRYRAVRFEPVKASYVSPRPYTMEHAAALRSYKAP